MPQLSRQSRNVANCNRQSITTDLVGGLSNGKTTDNVLRLACLKHIFLSMLVMNYKKSYQNWKLLRRTGSAITERCAIGAQYTASSK